MLIFSNRTLWKDKYELTYVGPNQVLVKTQGNNDSVVNMIVRSKFGREIDDVRVMGIYYIRYQLL